ncbi:pyrroline-5-carboxylate reductase [Clostridium sp. NSJ-49]|uniref:pyrroline-5-carboxylate reductase n=1 Tax=Clostridium TaxID=1485 RepID=UPI00164B6915|nr:MULTISPECIES: pyrroline-5-carboxylate reductase [unclassified Clostridium]MBC5624244.1 pyrroline-5-carboxylate reductase [Clostridium sp. NSJ-49]MCD2500851.1 pyrroline-5-carboxylate reductase [Clostridium sp. NSJ-145]MDU6340255.1 pyrroline-5-carboxylate reductase [Clostridium sp.]
MSKIIGFIGAGNMGQAILGGIVKAGLVASENIIMSDLYEPSLEKAKGNYNIEITTDNKLVAKKSDILILAVKPNLYPIVINEIKDLVKDDVIIVTIAAGKSIESTEKSFGRELKVIRTMPNTPALVGEGMTAVCPNKLITDNDINEVSKLLNSFSKVEVVSESLIDAVTSVSGSSPAYVYMFIEAMADAAVLQGMPRDKAYKFAAQTVLGSAKMVLETGMHPGALKDMVCSPGGTTIEAVAELEAKGFRSAVISAMNKCYKKSQEMSK